MPPATIDLLGHRFGRLIVVERAPSRNYFTWWLCRCDCGNALEVASSRLRRGETRSCGCLRRETSRLNHATHGHTRQGQSPTYHSWRAMIQRCHDKNHIAYPKYGAVGISVCRAWRHSFESFLNDMGERPEAMTLDRLDNRFGYFSANCRWATKQQQAQNQRTTAKYRDFPKLQALIDASPYRQRQHAQS